MTIFVSSDVNFPLGPYFFNNKKRILKATQTFWCPLSTEGMFALVTIIKSDKFFDQTDYY